MQTYTIYSVSNSPYQEWQAELLDYSFAMVSQPGKLIRLCSEDSRFPGRAKSESNVGETIFTPSFSDIEWPYLNIGRWYVKVPCLKRTISWPVMNKPGSLKYLFDHRVFDDDDLLLFLDPDMVFTKPWTPSVERGTVHGQKWFGYSKAFCQASSLHPECCPASQHECIMYPFAITYRDLKPIVDDIEWFSRAGYGKAKRAGFTRAMWMSDMPAFQTAMTKRGLVMDPVDSIGLCNNWKNKDDPAAPILHYCQPIRNRDGQVIWGKGRYQPWTMPPDPSLATNRVDREVLEVLTKKVREQTTR